MKYIYTYGVFDLFHAGHVGLLQDVAKLGDVICVGLFTDEVATKFKRKPIFPYEHREMILKNMTSVFKVVPQDELSPVKNIKKMIKQYEFQSVVVAKGPGANYENEFNKISEQTGALCVLLPYHPIASTTDVIKKIQALPTIIHGH